MSEHVYLRHHIELEIPFFDVDAMMIVWHGHYVKYFELARCALLDALGHDYTVMREQGFAYPVVKLAVKYVRPAAFRQRVRVECALTEYQSSLKLRYLITDTATGERLTEGSTMQAAVRLDNGETQFPTPTAWQRAVESHAGFCPIPR